MTTENLVKTVGCPTRLKLSEPANFNEISVKSKPVPGRLNLSVINFG